MGRGLIAQKLQQGTSKLHNLNVLIEAGAYLRVDINEHDNFFRSFIRI